MAATGSEGQQRKEVKQINGKGAQTSDKARVADENQTTAQGKKRRPAGSLQTTKKTTRHADCEDQRIPENLIHIVMNTLISQNASIDTYFFL